MIPDGPAGWDSSLLNTDCRSLTGATEKRHFASAFGRKDVAGTFRWSSPHANRQRGRALTSDRSEAGCERNSPCACTRGGLKLNLVADALHHVQRDRGEAAGAGGDDEEVPEGVEVAAAVVVDQEHDPQHVARAHGEDE